MSPVTNDPTLLEQLQQQKAELEQQNIQQARELANLQLKLKWYEEQLRLAQHKRFGASSEQTDPNQMELQLFNEAEVTAASAALSEPETETISYTRKKTSGKREVDLKGLPVEQRFYRLSEEEQICACCGGAMTLRTGTSSVGREYRYYTCSTKARQGATGCPGITVPMRIGRSPVLAT